MPARDWLEAATAQFRWIETLGRRAMEQLSDEQLFAGDDGASNSVAVVVKHITGNQRSRWTDFLTTDGEKPDRHRDTEFELDQADTREALMARWDAGWALVFDAVDLSDDQLDATIHIRGEPHSVAWAILRQVQHYAYHVGQIVHLARAQVGDDWQTLSVARGASGAYNARMREQTGREF